MSDLADDRPLVSVVIPSYNHARYVEQAIESVVRQTYSNIELVVVDDGSTDDSWAVIEALHARYKATRPFQIFRKPNGGPSQTLNYGIQRSSGSLVAILASDDWYHPDKVERQVSLFKLGTERVGVVHTGAYAFYEDGSTLEMLGQYLPAQGDCLHRLMALEMRVIAPSIMFRRTVYDEVGGFDETLKTEDIDFLAAVAAKGYELRYEPEPLMYKRSVKGSLGGNVAACAESHFKILQKHAAALSSTEYAWVHNRILRHEGRSWIVNHSFRRALRCYARVAKAERRVEPLVDFAAKSMRELILEIMPSRLRHALRISRHRLHVRANR